MLSFFFQARGNNEVIDYLKERYNSTLVPTLSLSIYIILLIRYNSLLFITLFNLLSLLVVEAKLFLLSFYLFFSSFSSSSSSGATMEEIESVMRSAEVSSRAIMTLQMYTISVDLFSSSFAFSLFVLVLTFSPLLCTFCTFLFCSYYRVPIIVCVLYIV